MKILSNGLILIIILTIAFSVNNVYADSLKWSSAKGPFGCDATAFFIEKKDNIYWLGTGSTGGVYYSKDKGKSWIECNNGIGPVHIMWIGEINLKIIIKVMPSYKQDYNFNENDCKWYELDKEHKKWNKILDPNTILQIRSESEKMINNVSSLFKSRFEILLNNNIDQFQYSSIHPEQIFGIKDIKSNKIYNLSRENVQANPIGMKDNMNWIYSFNTNFYFNENNELIILSLSGLYILKNNKIEPLGRSGLLASDIQKIICLSNDTIYAQVGFNEIWKNKKNKWEMIYSEHNNGDVNGNIGISSLQNCPNDSLIFTSSSGIWIINNKNGKRINIKNRIIQYNTENRVNYEIKDKGEMSNWKNAVIDKSGNIFCLSSQMNYDNIIFKIDVNGSLYPLEDYSGKFLFSDSQYNIWVVNEDKIFQIDSSLKEKNVINLTGNQKNEPIWFHLNNGIPVATYKDGTNVISVGNFLYIWNPITKWKIKETNISSITALCFDDKGKLYAGTGYFQYALHQTLQGGHADGLYYFNGNEWLGLKGSPNPWIVSLSYSNKHGLLVGTSGSSLFYYKP